MAAGRAVRTVARHVGGRALGRIALPVAIGASIYSAARTVKAMVDERKFEEERVRPLMEESGRWGAAISNLEAAARELSHSESVPFPHTRYTPATGVTWEVFVNRRRASAGAPAEEGVIVHDPDPAKALELVSASRENLAEAVDRRKANLGRRVKTLEARLESIVGEGRDDVDFEPMKKRIASIVEEMKKVRSDAEYGITALGTDHVRSRNRWALTVAGFAVLSALGVGGHIRRL